MFGILGAGLVLERSNMAVFGGSALLIALFNLSFTLFVRPSYTVSIGGRVGGLIGGILAPCLMGLSRFGRGHAVYGRLDLVTIGRARRPGSCKRGHLCPPRPRVRLTLDVRTLTDGGQSALEIAEYAGEVHLGCARETLDLALYDFDLRAADREARRERPPRRRRSSGVAVRLALQRRPRQPDPGTAASARSRR